MIHNSKRYHQPQWTTQFAETVSCFTVGDPESFLICFHVHKFTGTFSTRILQYWRRVGFAVIDIIWNIGSNSGHEINNLLRWPYVIDQFLIERRPWMLFHIPFRFSRVFSKLPAIQNWHFWQVFLSFCFFCYIY